MDVVSILYPVLNVLVRFYMEVFFVNEVRRNSTMILTKIFFLSLVSKQGKQIIIGIVLVIVLYALSFKPVRWVMTSLINICCQ